MDSVCNRVMEEEVGVCILFVWVDMGREGSCCCMVSLLLDSVPSSLVTSLPP